MLWVSAGKRLGSCAVGTINIFVVMEVIIVIEVRCEQKGSDLKGASKQIQVLGGADGTEGAWRAVEGLGLGAVGGQYRSDLV